MSVSPIETCYRNHLFRSRLEARWAVFLDALGIRWEYEKEGYQLDGLGYYLPDFWLPNWGLWLEIKGQPHNEDAIVLADALAEGTETAAALFHGLPCENTGFVKCQDCTESTGGFYETYLAQWAWDLESCRPVILLPGYEDKVFMDCKWNVLDCFNPSESVLPWNKSPMLLNAVSTAKQARFEHRKNPLLLALEAGDDESPSPASRQR